MTRQPLLFLEISISTTTNNNLMQDLIQRLMAEGLTEQQAHKAIEVIKNFTKEKFPMFGGAIDDLFDKYKDKDEDFLH